MRIHRNTGVIGRRTLSIAALVAVAAMVVAPTAAFGQQISPTQDQYEPGPGQIEQQVDVGGPAAPADGAPPSAPSDRVVSGLPFTGVDLGLIGAVAVLLTASGLALRRFAGGGASS